MTHDLADRVNIVVHGAAPDHSCYSQAVITGWLKLLPMRVSTPRMRKMLHAAHEVFWFWHSHECPSKGMPR